MDAGIPTSFGTADLQSQTVELGVRDGVDERRAAAVVDLVDAVDWDALTYAYGPAGPARGQLIAVALGDDATRERAWTDLWAGIWHQGTVYEATGPAVPLLAALAAWGSYPDRVRALALLREMAAGEGMFKAQVDAALADALPALFADWRAEPEAIRRALLWVLTATPDLRAAHGDLVDELLPAEHRHGWSVATDGAWENDAEYDAYCALEGWALAGSTEGQSPPR